MLSALRRRAAGSERKFHHRGCHWRRAGAASAGDRIQALRLQSLDRGFRLVQRNVRLIAPDQTTVLRKGQVKFALQDPSHHATNVTVFPQVEFPAAGVYYVEVLVDDVMKIRFPVPVAVVQPPQSATQPPAKQEPRG